MVKIIGVRFRNVGKIYYFNPKSFQIRQGDHVIVETARGVEYGTVVLGPKEVDEQEVVQPLKDVIRVATPKDDAKAESNRKREKEKKVKELLEQKLLVAEKEKQTIKETFEKQLCHKGREEQEKYYKAKGYESASNN